MTLSTARSTAHRRTDSRVWLYRRGPVRRWLHILGHHLSKTVARYPGPLRMSLPPRHELAGVRTGCAVAAHTKSNHAYELCKNALLLDLRCQRRGIQRRLLRRTRTDHDTARRPAKPRPYVRSASRAGAVNTQ